MAINDEIAAGGRPVQFENPLNNMVKMFSIRNDMQTNQMNQMKMDEANRVHGADIAFKNALRGIRDPNSPEGQLETDRVYFNAGFGDKRAAMRASEEASRKAYNEEQKQLEEEGYAAHREISSDPTDERIAERNRQIQNDIRYSADKKALAADNAGRLINMPYEQRKMEMARSGATVAERQPLAVDTTSGTQFVDRFTIDPIGKEIPKNLSADQRSKMPSGLEKLQKGYTEAEAGIKALLAKANSAKTEPERAQALADAKALSASNSRRGEEITRLQQSTQPLDAKDRRIKDYAQAIRDGRSPQDPEMKDMMAQIIHDRTHANQIRPPIDPRVVTHVTVKEDGTLVNQNALGEVVSTIKEGGKPSAQFAKTREQTKTLGKNLDLAIAELENATKDGGLIDQSTGSGLGKLANTARGFITGGAGAGAIAGAKLAPIADLGLKMVPRFEGPQSDKDTQSYKEASGQLADTSIPNDIRKDAGRTVLRLLKARKGQFVTPEMAAQGEAPAGGIAPPAGFVAD